MEQTSSPPPPPSKLLLAALTMRSTPRVYISEQHGSQYRDELLPCGQVLTVISPFLCKITRRSASCLPLSQPSSTRSSPEDDLFVEDDIVLVSRSFTDLQPSRSVQLSQSRQLVGLHSASCCCCCRGGRCSLLSGLGCGSGSGSILCRGCR